MKRWEKMRTLLSAAKNANGNVAIQGGPTGRRMSHAPDIELSAALSPAQIAMRNLKCTTGGYEV